MHDEDIACYRRLFIQRSDACAIQHRERHYHVHRHPVNDTLVRQHLAGNLTAAWYALDEDGNTRWGVYDSDRDEGLSDLQRLQQALETAALPAYLEASRRGGHLWLFCAPLPALHLRRLLQYFQRQCAVEAELFPKQDHPGKGGFGSCMRGPLGVHQVVQRRFSFLDPTTLRPIGSTLRDQLDYLATIRPIPAARITATIDRLDGLEVPPLETPPPGEKREGGKADPQARPAKRQFASTVPEDISALSDRKGIARKGGTESKHRRERTVITTTRGPQRLLLPREAYPHPPVDVIAELVKEKLDLRAIAAQFMQLEADGRGHCPFHPPDIHPSFAIKGKHWVCFHEQNPKTGKYRGGDVISFYAAIRGLSYNRAAFELAVHHHLF